MFTPIYKSVRKFLFIDLPRLARKLSSPGAVKAFLRDRVLKPAATHVRRSLNDLYRPIRQSRNSKIFLGAVVLIPPVTVLLLIVLLPLMQSPHYQADIAGQSKSSESQPTVAVQDISPEQTALMEKYYRLKMEEVYSQSRLEIARGDSINLLVNLIDSTVTLDIRGVPVRVVKIQEFEASRRFSRLKKDALLRWLSQSFELEKEMATIPKSPIVIKEAPKDTAEANEMAFRPLPPEKDDVYFALYFSQNLNIEFNQKASPSWRGRVHRALYNARKNWHEIGWAMGELTQFRLPQYPLWIDIKISRDDARAIYRALPVNAKLALYL